MITARFPCPKVADLRLDQRIVVGDDPGRLTLCRLVGWAWQGDCPPPPDEEDEYLGGWAWLEVRLEPIVEVEAVDPEGQVLERLEGGRRAELEIDRRRMN